MNNRYPEVFLLVLLHSFCLRPATALRPITPAVPTGVGLLLVRFLIASTILLLFLRLRGIALLG
jgi:hypothetical protein